MESLLKYLRGGAAQGNPRAPVVATTIAASACEDGGDVVVEDDAASFFDLEFAVPGDEGAASSDDAEEERVEFNFAVAASGAAEVVAVEEDAVAAPDAKKGAGAEEDKEEEAEPPPPAAASLLRPATAKFRVLMLKLRKPNKAAVPSAEGNGGTAPQPAGKTATTTGRFLIKFRVDDAPLVSLFTRDNSSRASTDAAAADNNRPSTTTTDAVSAEDEQRRFAREVLARYLNKIRPLYVKVSRLRRFPGGGEGEETDAEPDASPASSSQSQSQPQAQPQPVVVACGVRAPRASVPAGLKQVCKRLGKSRSASSAVAAAPSPPPPAAAAANPAVVPQRRDDSLLQLQDGIQSAIAHCKRSFNASKGCESPLLRSMTVGSDAIATTRDGSAADSSDGGA